MEKSTLVYAKKNIDGIRQENDIECYISDDNLIIELRSGRYFRLSEEEIKYQATEYLKSLILQIEGNF